MAEFLSEISYQNSKWMKYNISALSMTDLCTSDLEFEKIHYGNLHYQWHMLYAESDWVASNSIWLRVPPKMVELKNFLALIKNEAWEL
jgi:hypothetical protein